MLILAVSQRALFLSFESTNNGPQAELCSTWEDPDAGLASSNQIFPEVSTWAGFPEQLSSGGQNGFSFKQRGGKRKEPVSSFNQSCDPSVSSVDRGLC